MADLIWQVVQAMGQEDRQAPARCKLVDDVRTELGEFPWDVAFAADVDLTQFAGRWGRRTRMFRLGEYRSTWLDENSGHTALFVGADQELYEYGPKHLSVAAGEIDDNPIKLRMIDIDDLKAHELLLVRELLRRVWLV